MWEVVSCNLIEFVSLKMMEDNQLLEVYSPKIDQVEHVPNLIEIGPIRVANETMRAYEKLVELNDLNLDIFIMINQLKIVG